MAVAFLALIALVSGQGLFSVPGHEKKDDVDQVCIDILADTLGKGELFEGDLKISSERVCQVYDPSSMPVPVNSDNCNSSSPEMEPEGNSLKLWSEGVIYYFFDQSISMSLARVIRSAMDEWEKETCLHFVTKNPAEPSTSSVNCVNFTASNGDGCYSDTIGMQGGEQVVNLGSSDCHTHGMIMHLIGHVVGFWHENSRPDRDSYVLIVADNVDEGRRQDLMKFRGDGKEYASSGLLYDYGSIMHLNPLTFSKCGDACPCPTLVLRNPERYIEQDCPVIGQREALSAGDILKTKTFYGNAEDWKCPPSTKKGRLLVHVDRAYSLLQSGSAPSGYVKIVAKARNETDGEMVTILSTTGTRSRQHHPVWNEELDLGGKEWMPFFQIEVWDASSYPDQPISVSEEVMIDKSHQERIHCADPDCLSYVQYTYNFTEDGDECLSKPCLNGGTCEDGLSTYTCHCPPGWTGTNCHIRLACYTTPCQNGGTCTELTNYIAGISTYTCSCQTNFIGTNCQDRCPCQNGGTCVQPATVVDYRCLCPYGWLGTDCEIRRGRLRFYVRYGSGLPDEDGWFNDSDPYVKIIAYDHDGNYYTKETSVDGGDESPEWNQWLDFGTDTWTRFSLRVYDDDWDSDDALSSWRTVYISPGSHTYLTHSCYSGYIKYDYYFD